MSNTKLLTSKGIFSIDHEFIIKETKEGNMLFSLIGGKRVPVMSIPESYVGIHMLSLISGMQILRDRKIEILTITEPVYVSTIDEYVVQLEFEYAHSKTETLVTSWFSIPMIEDIFGSTNSIARYIIRGMGLIDYGTHRILGASSDMRQRIFRSINENFEKISEWFEKHGDEKNHTDFSYLQFHAIKHKKVNKQLEPVKDVDYRFSKGGSLHVDIDVKVPRILTPDIKIKGNLNIEIANDINGNPIVSATSSNPDITGFYLYDLNKLQVSKEIKLPAFQEPLDNYF